MAKATIKTASVLAFERKLSNSDAMMYAGNWGQTDNWQPIIIKEKAVRGTISNRLKMPWHLIRQNWMQRSKKQTYNVWMWPHCRLILTP